jgi:hypothetical protein
VICVNDKNYSHIWHTARLALRLLMPVLKDRVASIDVGHGIVKGSGAAIARVFSESRTSIADTAWMEEGGDGEH